MLSTAKKTTRQDNAKLLAGFALDANEVKFDDGKLLQQLEVVRYVPKRRCVCRATWLGQPVYAKIYFGEKAKQYALRDVDGIGHLQAAKVTTPNILYQGEALSPRCYVVIFEEIVSADNAENVWATLKEASRFELAKQLVQVVAQHHTAGLLQTDMYLKNFLVDGEKVYTIDGDGVRKLNALTKQKALSNLSVLLSKLDVLMLEQHLTALLAVYAEARAWDEAPDLAQMKAETDAARGKATHAYADKKVFRQCTDVDVVKEPKIWTAIRSAYSSVAIPRTEAELDAYFQADNILKNGNTCTVALAKIDDLSVVIKRYNIKGFWHGLGRALRKTRASVSWANAHRLQLLGIATANPIALIESRRYGLKGKAYFMTEYIEAPDITEFFEKTSDKVLRAKAVKEITQLFYQLYLLSISHGDMKANNIKVLATNPMLIDLDSMQQHRCKYFANKAHARDLHRFMRNWKDQPSLYNGFIKAFKVVYADHAPLMAANIDNN